MNSNQPSTDENNQPIEDTADLVEGSSLGAQVKKKPPMYQGDAADLLPQLQLYATPLEMTDISRKPGITLSSTAFRFGLGIKVST